MEQTIYNVKISGIGTLEEILKSIGLIKVSISVDVFGHDILQLNGGHVEDYEDATLNMELYEN